MVLGEGSTGGTQGGGNTGGTGGGTSTGGDTGGTQGGTGGGGTSNSWRDSLPEDIRNDASITAFQDVPSLTKAFIHTKGLVGKKGVIPPSDWAKATPEDKRAFYSSLGVPEKGKYAITLPKDAELPEGGQEWLQDTFAELGIMPHQGNEFAERYLKFESERMGKAEAEVAEEAKAQFKQLVEEWGGQEGYNAKLAAAEQLAQKCSPEFQKYLTDTGMGKDVMLIKEMYNLSRMFLSEGGELAGDGGKDPAASDKEVQAQIDEIMANGDSNGFYNAADPNHKRMVDKVGELRKRLTRGK